LSGRRSESGSVNGCLGSLNFIDDKVVQLLELVPQKLQGVCLIKPQVHTDSRGYFVETYKKNSFEALIKKQVHFVQDNESCSQYGTLRGLHFQTGAMAQSKLVRVVQGAVWDVAVDIRKGSPTYGEHIAVELSGANKHQLFIPPGFAHGFLTISDSAILVYKVDQFYSAKHERGIAFDDLQLGIKWPVAKKDIILSQKDSNQPQLSDLPSYFDFTFTHE